jgi:hypothetical protein
LADFSAEYLPTGDRRAPESMASGGYIAQQLGGLQFFLAQIRQPAKKARRNP